MGGLSVSGMATYLHYIVGDAPSLPERGYSPLACRRPRPTNAQE
jgi:hypothetical protein